MSLKPEVVDFDEVWGRLKNIIDNVINLRSFSRNIWTESLSDIYKLCVANPNPLSKRLYIETKNFINNYLNDLYKELEFTNKKDLLDLYYLKWKNYKKGIKYLNRLFYHLNTQHIRKQKYSDADISYGSVLINEQKLEIGDLGLYFWETNIIKPLKPKLRLLLLLALENDRLGFTHELHIKGVISSLVEVESYKKYKELYENVFEKQFILATGRFYKNQGQNLIHTFSCTEYLEKIRKILSNEELRCKKFIHESSINKVIHECKNKLIGDHLNILLNESVSMIVKECNYDLRNLYVLLKSSDYGLPIFAQHLQEHITDIGLKAVSFYLIPENSTETKETPINFVEKTLEVYQKYSEMIKDIFDNDQNFIRALDKALSTIINYKKNSKHLCKSPELLSRYCDLYLKKSINKKLSEFEVDDKLSSSITLFKYIDDKDVFQKFYSKMLSKRLIYYQPISMDCEESMINKLKQACGHEFVYKLYRILTDIKVSNDLVESFNVWCNSSEEKINSDLSFHIYILQAAAWPLSQTNISSFEIPLQLEKWVTNFEKFFSTKYRGRKLTWLHFLSTNDLKISFEKNTYLVTMSTYFMAILLLFENTNELSYGFIQESTKLTDEQLSKHLDGLIECKLLICDSINIIDHNSVTFKNSTILKFNLEFTNKRKKFRINALAQKEINQNLEIEQTHTSVDESRKLYLQAAIVRIMKSRKTIKHNELIQEVIHLSRDRFLPNLFMIKKLIEVLIEKQYMERKINSTDEYIYIA